jgi:malonyl-CoA/methylmalonyl-CoA synthetase
MLPLAEVLASPQPADGALPVVEESWLSRPAQILFTSGTTGKPKGAAATHQNLESGVRTLISAWGWGPRDHTLGVLPLHHTHGIINVLSCALAAGASIELFEKFDAVTIWDRLVRSRDGARVTLFMAVPTIYSKLIDAHSAQGELTRLLWSDAAKRLRLWVSGSAALPVSMLEVWRGLTGHTLLERYGMTEIGMALSNPLAGERTGPGRWDFLSPESRCA